MRINRLFCRSFSLEFFKKFYIHLTAFFCSVLERSALTSWGGVRIQELTFSLLVRESHLVWTVTRHYDVHKSPPLNSVLSQLNPLCKGGLAVKKRDHVSKTCFKPVFILLSEQHNYIVPVYWYLFSSTTCFGCLFQPLSGRNTGLQKEEKRRDLSLQTLGIGLL